METVSYSNKPVEVTGEKLGETWWRGRQWCVTSDGVEALNGEYFIDAGTLAKTEGGEEYGTWPVHVSGKVWVDVDDFVTAWLVGLSMHGQYLEPDVVRRLLLLQRRRQLGLPLCHELDEATHVHEPPPLLFAIGFVEACRQDELKPLGGHFICLIFRNAALQRTTTPKPRVEMTVERA